jgi:hypothetical protein
MMNEQTHNAGESRMGTDIPFEDVSAVSTVDATRRPRQRDGRGRFARREARMVGPLGPAGGVGDGGVDAVTGRWISGVRNNAVLHDFERVHEVTTRPVYEFPDWSGGADPVRRSHAGAAEAHALANHFLTCPCHTTGDACCG